MDNVNPNTNSTTSGLNNVLSGVGIFILGIPVFFITLMSMALSGVGVSTFIFLVVSYGIIGYILGKIKPNLKWKSGLLLTLGSIFVVVVLSSMGKIVDFKTSEAVGLVLLSLAIVAVSSISSSYFGSRSRKTWQGSVSNIVFIIFVLVTVYGIGSFIIGGLKAQQQVTMPVTPVSNY